MTPRPRILALLVVAFLFALPARAADPAPVRFGLTSVVVRENVPFYQAWSRYLAQKIGRPVQFVQRRSYREIMELLETGQVDFAWICGYPYVRHSDQGFFDLFALPEFEGAPLYRSYIIVHRDSPLEGLPDLEDRTFAFSDPDSNSGYLVPRSLVLKLGKNPDAFFRLTFFTYSHAETIEAVAEKVAEGGAVDSYVWEYLARTQPQLTRRTKVIFRSELFGFPPIVALRHGNRDLNQRMAEAIIKMNEDAEGRRLLRDLALDRFSPPDPKVFDGIRRNAENMKARMAAIPRP